jgi:micrococcal nuclease|tara:strand:- start:483 stop:923 length:441 start_codon:yes stop_codon:yes gene_type:complete
MYEYRVNIVKVVDGDTVDVDIDLGFGVWIKDERVRIMGIDTPESRTRDKEEKVFGLAAKTRLKELLGKGAILQTQINKDGEDMKGKFGRILGDFLVDQESGEDAKVTVIMIAENHAVEYWGQSKDDIVEAHMRNRQILIDAGTITI